LNWLLLLCNVVLLNVVLSGDNALAISMAASPLPRTIRKKAIVLGSIISIVSLIVFVIVGSFVIELPFLKSVAGLLLLWIAIHLVGEQKVASATEDQGSTDTSGLWKAIFMITLADLSMELDNALAMVSVADGRISVLMVGFLVTIPFLVFGSHFVSRLMQKFPWIIIVAATYISWIAGSMIASDKLLVSVPWHAALKYVIPSCCVLAFLALQLFLKLRLKHQIMLENGQDVATPEHGQAVL
jgi:YjbE family integral membrane protein